MRSCTNWAIRWISPGPRERRCQELASLLPTLAVGGCDAHAHMSLYGLSRRESVRRVMQGMFVGAKARLTHLPNNRTKLISGVSSQPANREMFMWDGHPSGRPTQVSVAEYFRLHYNMPLTHPHLPCLLVGSGPKRPAVPAQVLEVLENQRVSKELMGKARPTSCVSPRRGSGSNGAASSARAGERG